MTSKSMICSRDLRLFPLEGCEIRLDLGVLGGLALYIIVDTSKLLESRD